jgi:L-ribulose-5-phosphate 3-epimerase UlaE
VSFYTLGLYEKAMPGSLSLAEKLAAIGEGGYDFMELSIEESPQRRTDVRFGHEGPRR